MAEYRQQQILDALREWSKHHSYPPTVRELGALVGLKSSATIAFHLAQLEHFGMIRRQPGMSRTIELLAPDVLKR